MKISDHGIGRKALEQAQNVETLANDKATGAKKTAQPDAPTGGLDAAVAELKSTLDQVRNLLGQRAVDRLVQELPKAAVDALQAAKGELPVEAGKSPYLTFKAKSHQLMEMEAQAKEKLQAFEQSGVFGDYSHHVAKAPYSLSSQGKNLEVMQRMESREAVQKANPNAKPGQVRDWEKSARAGLEKVNDALRMISPDIAEADLCMGLYGDGPGTRAVKEVLQDLFGAKNIETMRDAVPGYAETLRDVAALKSHLADVGVSSEDKVIALKAEVFSDEIPIEALHSEAIKLIGEIAGLDGSGGMTASSQLKREKVQDSHQSTVQSSGSGSSHTRNYNRHGTPDGSSSTYSSHDSTTRVSGSVTREILRPSAREYTVMIAPDADKATDRVMERLDKTNYVDAVEVPILVDRLLTVRRLYEAMAVREPDSAYTGALRSWVEESDFKVVQIDIGKFGGTEDHNAALLNMGNLRNDVLGKADRLGLPEHARGLVKEELNLGPARKKGPLSSLSSLSSL